MAKIFAMDRADFWELRARALEWNGVIAQAKATVAAAAASRDALVRRLAEQYQFDAQKDFQLDDADCTLRQEP